jgi:glycosyltransferase involved in cell wall biosynthesis
MLASTPDEWRRALQRLLEDPELRQSLGTRGRAFVERYADLDVQADVLAALLRGYEEPRSRPTSRPGTISGGHP